MGHEFVLMRNALRAVYAALNRSPYDGPEPCVCGHVFGDHCGNDATASCMAPECDCAAFERVA